MGFFNRFKKDKGKVASNLKIKEQQRKDTLLVSLKMDKERVNLSDVSERKTYIKDNCEQIIEATRQIDEARVEYQAVTSYLTDMQRIDRIPIEDRQDIDDAARKIITLLKERAKYQNRKNIKISAAQYKQIELYEDEISEQIVNMKQYEEYNIIVKNDMRNLEGEKGSLLFQKEEIIHQQKYLKGLAILTAVIVISLFALFFTLATVLSKDMVIPYILTIIMAAVSLFYICYEARRNIYEMKRTEIKSNKAIRLLNRVKIKYINTNNWLDYVYSKYMVNTSSELNYLWEQYVKAKDEEKRYKDNTDLLNYYNETLIAGLKGYKIADPEVWIHQAIAIIDGKEMVEVRHRLNVRRQKLRERIDYNTKLKEDSTKDLQDMTLKNPEWKPEVIKILSEHDIHI